MNVNRLAAAVTTVAVIAALAAGLYFTGSPETQRELRLDERRVADLRGLAAALEDYWESHGELPADLAGLVDGQRLTALPGDPETAAPYGYEQPTANTFRLCADFSRAAPEAGDFWAHPAGRQCFGFEMDPAGAGPR